MSYHQNIMTRAKNMRDTNALNTYDTNLVKIYKNNFGKDYKTHISDYFDDNKINITRKHFHQIIDLLILFYDDHKIYKDTVFDKDMKLFMGELVNCGYYFTEEDAMYCIDCRMFIPDFKISSTTTLNYKKFKNLICIDVLNDNKLPEHYVNSVEDALIRSYLNIRKCRNITHVRNLFKEHKVEPNYNHLQLFYWDHQGRSKGSDYKRIVGFFTDHNLTLSQIIKKR